ncbi:uncharacterized protein LOC117180270 [Belonocnema kinseyi]|uniref:uncharacterized protein LOC117180270 n=1 Tax=Belonocnema kinseyi TaxID=2817044 RepID=UPI00143D5DF7|nr:uncharacterized protein LOC117180270 [Belonocnema kinseyi]XP_033228565.1 uncharacterized protein LOC117180270 [Belonocnema kinseyi]
MTSLETISIKCCLNDDKGKNDMLLNAFIIILGESEDDILRQENEKHLKLPNKRNISFSSNFSSSERHKKVKGRRKKLKHKQSIRRKLEFPAKEAKEYESEKILSRHFNLLKNRRNIIDSPDSDKCNASNKNHGIDELGELHSNDTLIIDDKEVFEDLIYDVLRNLNLLLQG